MSSNGFSLGLLVFFMGFYWISLVLSGFFFLDCPDYTGLDRVFQGLIGVYSFYRN